MSTSRLAIAASVASVVLVMLLSFQSIQSATSAAVAAGRSTAYVKPSTTSSADEWDDDEQMMGENSDLNEMSDDLPQSASDGDDGEETDGDPAGLPVYSAVEPHGLDSIANAKIRMSGRDMQVAAGHHHHHGHYVSGKLEMGAHTGKKGAFGWHDKHPVGGKGRR